MSLIDKVYLSKTFKKYFFIIFFIVLLPFFCLSMFFIWNTEKENNRETIRLSKNLAEKVIVQVQEKLEDSLTTFLILSKSTHPQEIVKHGKSTLAKINNELDLLKKGFDGMYIFDQSGNLSDSIGTSLELTVKKQLLEMIQEKKSIDIIDDDSFMLVEPIISSENKTLGYIMSLISIASLQRNIEREDINTNKFQFFFIPKIELSNKLKDSIVYSYLRYKNFTYILGVRCCVYDIGFNKAIYKYIIVLVIIGFLLALVVSYLITQSLQKPISNLVLLAKEINSETKFNTNYNKLSERLSNRMDEFSVLANAINMSYRVAMKLEEERRVNARFAAIGHTTAILAHDVRKPFSKLQIMLDSFDTYRNSPKQLAQAKLEIEKSLRQVDSMIDDIMDFSREVKLETKPESVVDMTDFSIREVTQSTQEVDIQFNYDFQHSHKPLADNERLVRVFSNIIGNGIEAIRDIGKRSEGTIAIGTREIEKDGKEFIEITIANDGPQIPEEDIPNLFESFFTKGKKKGTGLGLASAQKIVNLHGGEIAGRNKKGDRRWTIDDSKEKTVVEFVMTIPASNEKEEMRIENLPKNSKEAAFIELRKDEHELDEMIATLKDQCFKIVLLEDESLYRTAVKNTIRKNEILNKIITIYDAQTVDEALEVVKREHIIHAIVDIDLGDVKNGFDFLAALSQQLATSNQQPKCMVHSNRHLDEFRQKAFSLGAKAFVPKPLALEHLVDFLAGDEKVLGSRHSVLGEEIREPKTENRARKILVLDDDPMILDMNGNILIEYFESPEVFKVHSPEKGLELMNKYPFDYVFSDINFDNSNLDGYEFVRRVRKENQEVKIHLVSSTPRSVGEEEALRAGADGFIEAPITTEKIREGLGFRGQDLERNKNQSAHSSLTPNPQILNPNPFISKLFHDLNRPYVELFNFFRDYNNAKAEDDLFVAKKERLLKLGEHAREIRTLLLNYLNKSSFTIEDSRIVERITKELQAMNELKERSFMPETEVFHGNRREKTYS